MKRILFTITMTLAFVSTSRGHNPGAYLTWNREISRVFFARCASCHHQGGSSFSLVTYLEVQPHLTEIKEQVLGRKMPPWGAVKGFGDFRNDQGLTQEEIELIGDWIEQDAPKGNNPNLLPPLPKFSKDSPFTAPTSSIRLTSNTTLDHSFILDGIYPRRAGKANSARIVAMFPDGHMEPLLWLFEYKDSISHAFLYRNPIELPAGTRIQGVPPESEVVLLPGKKTSAKGKK